MEYYDCCLNLFCYINFETCMISEKTINVTYFQSILFIAIKAAIIQQGVLLYYLRSLILSPSGRKTLPTEPILIHLIMLS